MSFKDAQRIREPMPLLPHLPRRGETRALARCGTAGKDMLDNNPATVSDKAGIMPAMRFSQSQG
jgi:hypothetical protein